MKNKKWLVTLLVLALCGAALFAAACGGTENDSYAEMADAWNGQNQNTFKLRDDEAGTRGLLCLGEYNRYVILFDNYAWGDDVVDVSAVVTSITAGDYVFYYGYPFSLYAYKDDAFNDLRDIYAAGGLTDGDIAATYAEYITYYPNIYVENDI